jgi:superfamily I DNA/RNA helicase
MSFVPDREQAAILAHDRGTLLVTGAPGTGKTTVLRERFARLVEAGAEPERIALVVRTKGARAAGRAALLQRLEASLPAVNVLTVHGLGHHVLAARFGQLDYDHPPDVLTAQD